MFKDSDVYENIPRDNLKLSRTACASPGANDDRKGSSRGVAVLLCLLLLLLLLLLTGLITLAVMFTRGRSEWEMKMAVINNSHNNQTREGIDLKARVNNVTQKLDQLQTSFNSLSSQHDQLKRRLGSEITALLIQLGWRRFQDSFYYISSQDKSWLESREDCLKRNADLVIVNTKEEQNFLRSFRKQLWLGLTDKDREGFWTWVDGTPLIKSYWNTGEPNGVSSRDEDCGEIMNFEKEKGWNDKLCNLKQYWICEMTFSI
ncbi:CD209 antigen-like protein C [Aulostomus maculatus]